MPVPSHLRTGGVFFLRLWTLSRALFSPLLSPPLPSLVTSPSIAFTSPPLSFPPFFPFFPLPSSSLPFLFPLLSPFPSPHFRDGIANAAVATIVAKVVVATIVAYSTVHSVTVLAHWHLIAYTSRKYIKQTRISICVRCAFVAAYNKCWCCCCYIHRTRFLCQRVNNRHAAQELPTGSRFHTGKSCCYC